MTSWHPDWPGVSGRGSLLLPLPAQDFDDLSDHVEVDGLRMARKPEFHVTLLDREATARVPPAALPRLFAARDWRWRRDGERWLLREHRAGVLAHTIIELLDMPALDAFRTAVMDAMGVALAPVPAHVTLYTANTAVGIGLASLEEFKRLRVHPL